MKNAACVLLFFLFVSVSAFAQTPSPNPIDSDDVVRISTTLIQIDATVTDKTGNPIRDLRREEIEIFENGKRQEITNFAFISAQAKDTEKQSPDSAESSLPLPPTRLSPNQVRRTIALVVDDLSLSFESTHQVRRALKNFVENQMQKGDLVAIIRTAGGIGALQQFTSDKRRLFAAIEKVKWNFRSVGIGAFSPIGDRPLSSVIRDGDDPRGLRSGGEIDVEDFREDIFATGTLGAIEYVVRGMRELPGRKSVMLMSDGFSLRRENREGFIESTRVLDSLTRLIDQANRSSVVIYTIDARGLQTTGFTAADSLGGYSPDQIRRLLSGRFNRIFITQEGLNYLATQTGGIPFRNNNDLSGGIRKMLEDQSYYVIGYQPDGEVFEPEKRKFNVLEVKVNRKDAIVRYRSGFFGMTDEEMNVPSSDLSDAQRLNRALASPFSVNDISLNLSAIFRGDAKKNLYVNSFLYIDLDDLTFREDPDGTMKADFDLLAMIFGDNGIPADGMSQKFSLTLTPEQHRSYQKEGIVYTFAFPIKKAGAYQMRVAIRDHSSQKVGSANQFIEVPKLKEKRIRLSGMIVDNLSYKAWRSAGIEAGKNSPDSGGPVDTGVSSVADTAVRRFKRGSVLYYALEAYNAAVKSGGTPQLESQTRLYRNGKSIFEGKVSSIEIDPNVGFKMIPINGAINLGSAMEPGEYVLQIVVTDKLAKKKLQVASQYVQFEIVE